VNHSGGHLPFEVDITPFIQSNANYSKVRVVALVNNTLTSSTLPPGEMLKISPTRQKLSATFDFFNYAGIDRSVILYSTSSAYIEDITINTESIDYDAQHVATSAILTYSVVVAGANPTNALPVLVQLLDANGIVVANSTDSQSRLVVNKPNLWEPCGMNHTHACTEESYLYTLQVTVYNDSSPTNVVDIYRIPHVGIRTVRLTNSQFLVNERPFYFHGANAHEDSDIRGKGFDSVILTKHFNLYGWLHGNSFRTSHYPYADEFYQMADRYGLAIIGETPAVGLAQASYFSAKTLEHHKQVVTEMINRDKNHPSVLMWSLANEPASDLTESEAYFSELVNFTRPIAASRPITFVSDRDFGSDKWVKFIDVICINRYFGWYSESGDLDAIPGSIRGDLEGWRNHYPTKPIIISEYGADTVPGLHSDPPLMFTEEYQKDFYTAYHGVFDQFSSILHSDTGYLVGELPWNMFDFATDQSVTRVGGLNRKGLFTRQRQPKAAAFVIKDRYEQLELIATLPHNTA
jgi:beta-glucuronidase